MNPARLDRIVPHVYESIRECDLELKELNVLVGSNNSICKWLNGRPLFLGYL